jgi:hypothetical protein
VGIDRGRQALSHTAYVGALIIEYFSQDLVTQGCTKQVLLRPSLSLNLVKVFKC